LEDALALKFPKPRRARLTSSRLAGFLAGVTLQYIASLVFLAAGVVLATNLWVVAEGEKRILFTPPTETRDFVIVLGAGVHGVELSGALRSRMALALELYRKQLVRNILLSGDGTDPWYNETVAMKRFALMNDIPASRIFADAKGYSTYDSVLRAKEMFGVETAYVVSQKFHLSRVLWLSNAVGIDVLGVPTGPVDGELYYSMREIPARTKDFFLHVLDYFPQGRREAPF
jgi:vancomycin permeability regulator SanA